jgi:peptidoglycan/LPS O-acetylase OafA/YrhL
VYFSGVRGGHLVFASNFNHSEVVLCRGLLLPQSWTLGVELTFYLLAPFILKDRRKLMLLLLASFGLRACLLMQGIGFSDPWSCRFFPSELGLFLLGALSQQLLSPLWKRAVAKVKKLPHWGTGVLVCFTVAFCGIPLPYEIVLPVFLASAALLMPLTFFFQNSFAMDKWIGELSYPIYIGHILVFHLLNPLLHTLRIQNNVLIANANVAASILLAIILNHFLIRRLDALRERLRSASGKQRRANSEVCA